MSSKEGKVGASSITGAGAGAGLDEERAAREVVVAEDAGLRDAERGFRTYVGVAVDAKRTLEERKTGSEDFMNDMMVGLLRYGPEVE